MRLSDKPLITAEAIRKRVNELGAAITRDFAGHTPLMLTVLKGAAPFSADLMRAIHLELTLEYVRAQSYAGAESTGTVEFHFFPDHALAGRDVVVVEDILDTGRTATALTARLKEAGVASVSVATLLDKPECRVVPIEANYVGFEIGPEFVVGYGLDHDEQYRHLDAVYTVMEMD
jgi:hypoxanthine phosphoribosyltransferase